MWWWPLRAELGEIRHGPAIPNIHVHTGAITALRTVSALTAQGNPPQFNPPVADLGMFRLPPKTTLPGTLPGTSIAAFTALEIQPQAAMLAMLVDNLRLTNNLDTQISQLLPVGRGYSGLFEPRVDSKRPTISPRSEIVGLSMVTPRTMRKKGMDHRITSTIAPLQPST